MSIVLIGIIAVALISFAVQQSTVRIHNVGVIRVLGVEAYADEDLTIFLEKIDWGNVSPGENKPFPVWIKNVGSHAQKLVMWTEKWIPVNASDWITLDWNYNGTWIASNASIPLVFTLKVHPEISGITGFRFEIWVKAVA